MSDKFFKGWSMSYSFSQPYNNWSHPVSSVEKQLIVLEAIDNIVQNMLTFPDVEAILNKINKENRHD